jgi:glyoxylase-like metal-dependent hydrolase (beta-lactamase superfamily II)
MPSVFLLKPGSIERDEFGRILDARSSVTLIINGRHKIVVDSGLLGEEEPIMRALAELGIKPEEIDCIVNTHSHSDHCGNNHLFFRAKILAAKEGDVIVPGVWVLATPGHSMDSISVAVETKAVALQMKANEAELEKVTQADTELENEAETETKLKSNDSVVIIIAGDALPTLGNLQKNVPPASHVDRDLATASMLRIIALADVVIPGHDFPFSIRKKAYVPLPFRIGPGEGSAGCKLPD